MFFRKDRGLLKSRKQQTIDEMEELHSLQKDNPLEKGDLLALFIAAVITLLPIVLVVLGAYYLISMFLFY